jgi:hypothetical protein
MLISLPQEASSLRTGSHQRTILACTRPILIGHAVELATDPTTSHDDGQAQTDASAGPAPPAPASRRGADSGRPRAGHGRSGRPRRPRPSQPYGCCPPPRSRTSLRPDTADAATRRHRTPTPDADTGRRTADTWTLRRPHRTLDSGPVDRQAWTLVARTGHQTPDTGHQTPDTGRGRGQGDEAAAGIRTSWATTPSDRTLGRPTVFLWTAPAALDSPCRLGGEAAFQREIASRRQLLGRSAGVERRLGALLSSDDCGSSVERTAKLHPLWQWVTRPVGGLLSDEGRACLADEAGVWLRLGWAVEMLPDDCG